MFGIKENKIHPVRNYTKETECVLEMSILTLRGLRQIVRLSGDFLTDMIARKKSDLKQLKKKYAAMKIGEKNKPQAPDSDDESKSNDNFSTYFIYYR